MSHCFISYSHADGLDFVTRLADELEGGHPFINVWFEKREMVGSRDDWDDQLAKAIQQCKCLLFVMSKDSTAEHSNCKAEWTWALKYKKPVICLWIGNDAKDQFRLNSRQKLDFTSNFTAGLAKLRKTIAFLDSDEGKLEELKHRLADANRDLSRASEEDKGRIQAEIEDLNKQIEMQQKIVDNPEAAEKQTQDNIAAGLERERQPEKPVAGKTSTRFINPPPGIAPNYFQDRFDEIKEIKKFLENDAQRLLTIVGRAGVGKTAMVCRLLKALERGELPDDLGEMKVDGIVYLSETGSHRVNFANVFADLSKLLPPSEGTAERLEGIYKSPQTSTGDKMRALLDAFPSGRVILLLDNFETLIDAESLSLRDSELSDALNALLGGQHHAVKAVITTRIAPRDLAVSEPGRQHHLSLDEGLESPYAENVLREMDADGRVGLESAPDALLNKAREKTRGYPRALEALYAILSVDRYTTLEELLELSLPDEVVQKLVGEAFNRLDPSAQKVMQALAVYNRPVSPAAIDYLLQPHLPSIDSALVLNRLMKMHFARREAGRYYLHPVDKEYVFSIIPTEKDLATKDKKDAQELRATRTLQVATDAYLQQLMQKPKPGLFDKFSMTLIRFSQRRLKKYSSKPTRFTSFNLYSLQQRAADYFAQARKPRAEWKKLEDLTAQLTEFDLRCGAGDYDTALTVLLEIDSSYLGLWGHARLAIDLHEKLQGKITDALLKQISAANLGSSYDRIGGQSKEAIKYLTQAHDLLRERKNPLVEASILGMLGNAYSDLGDVRKAIEYYDKSLVIVRKFGIQQGESAILIGLGSAYSDLGDVRKAIEYHEQSAVINREIGSRLGESTDLSYLGVAYYDLGEARKAMEYYEQALVIDREIGNRDGEAADYNHIGRVLLSLDKFEDAEKNFMEARRIADEILFLGRQAFSRYWLAQAYIFQSDLFNARATIEAARQYDVPMINHNATALHGIVALRQGNREIAQEAFTKSIAQADEILAKTPDYYDALDAKGLALCGLAILASYTDRTDNTESSLKKRKKSVPSVESVYKNDAIETFKKAREIAPHAGVVKSVLRLFDELVKCDENGILKDVRDAVQGK